MDGLIDVYENVGLFKVDRPGDLQVQMGTTRKLADDAPILFEALRYKGSPGIEDGQPVIVEYLEFKELFDASTLGVLQKVRIQDGLSLLRFILGPYWAAGL